MDIRVEGLHALKADIRQTATEIAKAGDKALQAVGLEIVAEAKVNLNANKTNNTGMLRSSGKVQKAEDGTVDAGFFSDEQHNGYAEYVEYGRGPSRNRGPVPLEDSLKAWVHRKLGIAYGKELDSVTYLIARKIHREGTKPQPFFVPAVQKIEGQLEEIVTKYIRNESENV